MNLELATLKTKLHNLLRWTEKWTKTDMVYLARGGFWLATAQVVNTIISFVLSVTYANLLPKNIFGTYKYILSIYGILSAFSLTGYKTATSQSAAKGCDGILELAYKKNFKWNFFISFASVAASIYYFFQQNYILSFSMILVGIFSPFLNSAGFYGAFLNGKKNFKLTSIFTIINNTLSAICLIGVMFFSQNVLLLVFAYFSINTSITTILYIKTLKYKKNNDINQDSIKFGKHLSLMNVLSAAVVYLDKILVFHYLGAVQLAVYSFAIAVPEQINNMIKNIYTLALPKFANKSVEEIKKYTWIKIFRLGIFLFLLTLLIILSVPYVFRIFFPEYMESIIYSQLFSFSVIAVLMYVPISILHAQNKIKELYQYNLFTSVSQIAILFSFIYTWGLGGAIAAQILGPYINLITSLILLKKLK